MTAPEFALLPGERLLIHEEIVRTRARALARHLRKTGRIEDPIWVDRESLVILNGHHRFAALRELGATRIPVWLFDYSDPRVRLDRWGTGPPLTKQEVVERGRNRRPFPPKTSRHSVEYDLPEHPTTLAELLPAANHPIHGAPRPNSRPTPR